ncbi:MAG: ankyrin repeat domain-containing protein [Blastocatellia bacterium]
MADLQLIDAVKTDNFSTAAELINLGAEVNQQDDQGWTPLNWAAGKGNLELVKLLVDHGADVFRSGRDQRTPYMIALAAGHIEVVKFLRDAEDKANPESVRPQRKYCKAYHLSDLRRFSAFTESKINWTKKEEKVDQNNGNGGQSEFSDDDIVFIHQDFTVTRSMWENEDVIFNQVSPEWRDFCARDLGFKVPDDLDLIVSAKGAGGDKA